MKFTPAGTCSATSRSTAPLTEPTSVRIAPDFRLLLISLASGPQAPTGTHRMTRSAPLTVSRAVSCTLSVSLRRFAVPRVASLRACPAICLASPFRRMAWASDEPIRPRPISATLSNIASAMAAGPAFAESPQCRHEGMIGFLAADRQPQRIGKTIGLHAPEDHAGCAQESIRLRRFALGEMNQQKISHARRRAVADFGDFRSEPWQPLVVMRHCALDMRRIGQCRLRRCDRRRIDVERAPDPVERIGHLWRTIGPPDPEARQPIDL